MAWNVRRAEERIRKHLTTVPEIAAGTILSKRYRLNEVAAGASDEFPNGRATLVEGVHMYGLLLDFEDVISENQRETEQSHKRVLQFLDIHYRVWDTIIEDDDAIRVDYHGPRLHTVITRPEGNPAEQISRAIALAFKLEEAAKQVGKAYNFPARVRFGIDWGQCLAMGTGRSHEKDVLFLGSPANHAAKAVAAEKEPGIVLAQNAKSKLSSSSLARLGKIVRSEVASQEAQRHRFDKLEAAAVAISKNPSSPTEFEFHRAVPPLSRIQFEKLVPSNSVRMGMASIFADIDGYTAYVDNSIKSGERAIGNAVRDIHVLREELNSVLKEDFGGKRVRFIGDCIQGILAEGGAKEDDVKESVRSAAFCAFGMQSSFKLAQEILKTIDKLGLAIGIEYGQVPLTRLGNRGDESVRCAAGMAVVHSERMQQSIQGAGVQLGEVALRNADARIQSYFGGGAAMLMEYADAADHFAHYTSPSVQIIRNDPSARSHLVETN